MFLKKDWFKTKGFGFFPATWEGWVFIAVILLLVVAALNIPVTPIAKVIIAALVLGFFLVEVLAFHFERYPDLEEHEKRQQHIVYTTVAYSALIALVCAFLFEVVVQKKVDWPIFIVTVTALFSKVVVSFLVYRK